jgi:hypothetical protein
LQVIHKAIRITSKLNNLVINDLAELNVLFGELIGKKVDDTFFMIPPFFTFKLTWTKAGERVESYTRFFILSYAPDSESKRNFATQVVPYDLEDLTI